jgi:hypothetical protein
MIHIQVQYEHQIIANGLEREKLTAKEKYLPLMRFFTFVSSLVLIYNYLIFSNIVFVYLSVATLISFFIITLFDNQLKAKIERSDRLIQICRNEINSMRGDYSPFEPGEEFIDTDHSYTYDLDMFGKNSLFHCINRSVTIFGKNRLAEYLNRAYNFHEKIPERQKAVYELSESKEFRQQMQLVFFGQKTDEKDRLEFKEWLESDNPFLRNRLINIVRFTLPLITITLIILAVMNLVMVQIPVMMVILQLMIVSGYSRKTVKVQSLLTSKVDTISRYSKFLFLIGKGKFKTPFLSDLNNQLSHDGVETPARIIKQLSGLLNWMDSNLNIIAAVLLNGVFLFNLHMLIAVDKWKAKYREVIPRWYEIIGEFDALASLANFACNNPDYIYPQPVEDQFRFEAFNMGHPLIPKAECVTNSFTISGWKQYCIVTGANMSGKSTFLRTVGTNYVLAMIGAPVFASVFVFYPIMLHSSIRTSDSLARKESFFYAELKRLKGIISELESGQRTFILLDEILKGTNSKDKQAGSIALLEQLIKYHSVGLIATHDLMLGDLISTYPENIHNLCFEIKIVDDEMSIDYKLQDGVCQNLNATFLMKKMGILIDK